MNNLFYKKNIPKISNINFDGKIKVNDPIKFSRKNVLIFKHFKPQKSLKIFYNKYKGNNENYDKYYDKYKFKNDFINNIK